MHKQNQWGPFALDLGPGERLARLLSLRALACVLAGPRAIELCELLHQAETDPAALVPAANALDHLAPLDMRRVLSTYAGLTRPLPPARRGAHSYPRSVVMVTPRPPVRVTPSRVARAQPRLLVVSLMN